MNNRKTLASDNFKMVKERIDKNIKKKHLLKTFAAVKDLLYLLAVTNSVARSKNTC